MTRDWAALDLDRALREPCPTCSHPEHSGVCAVLVPDGLVWRLCGCLEGDEE